MPSRTPLAVCPGCSCHVKLEDAVCPSCGASMRSSSSNAGLWSIPVIVAMGLSTAVCSSSEGRGTTSTSGNPTTGSGPTGNGGGSPTGHGPSGNGGSPTGNGGHGGGNVTSSPTSSIIAGYAVAPSASVTSGGGLG